ncbi:YnjH family protein [Serratia sp. AKBS12]|uniref:YnjH family protein n=1 Tax=Serratia sp. AKBS12 TaxID=2974597 RepID=UPI0021651706|nr:YnjH family protein [Serratia sp. AKBS12]MCS3408485.1 YnjH family protein [Serratia sp. AKBS12]
MKQLMLALVAGVLLCSAKVHAHRGDVDVQLPVSPEIWGTAKSAPAPQPCAQCCVYQDQNYSQGALLKVEGELLQCTRDPTVVGSASPVWVRLKK